MTERHVRLAEVITIYEPNGSNDLPHQRVPVPPNAVIVFFCANKVRVGKKNGMYNDKPKMIFSFSFALAGVENKKKTPTHT